MSIYSTVLARRLREERQRLGMSQAELARRMSSTLGVGIDGSAVSRIENPASGRTVKLDEAAAAADALSLPLGELLRAAGADHQGELMRLQYELDNAEAMLSIAAEEVTRRELQAAELRERIREIENAEVLDDLHAAQHPE